jgi:NAD(P)H-dependent FMN reductase
VDDAMEQYIALFDAWSARLPGAPESTASEAAVSTDEPPPLEPPVGPLTRSLRLLLVSGSLRRASTNTAVLRTAMEVAPEGVCTVLFGQLDRLPPFNPDDDNPPLPRAVNTLRRQIRDADGLLFSVPEYAGGLPGAFKNLLDWTIGDDQPGSIYEKPVAWINTSVRTAADAHESLRKVLGYASASIVEAACIHVPVAPALVDDGRIADRSARAAIAGSVAQLAANASSQ